MMMQWSYQRWVDKYSKYIETSLEQLTITQFTVYFLAQFAGDKLWKKRREGTHK